MTSEGRVGKTEGLETCPRCDGEGSICLACKCPITDCECFEDSEPCMCDRCNGRGKTWGADDDEDEQC